MNRSIFWALVRKDLYLQRGLIVMMLAVGVASWLLMSRGGKAFAVGGVLFLTANVAGAIFIAVLSLFGERKEQARIFALSLPISGRAYDLSKLTSGYLTFSIPWLLLTLLAVGGVLLPGGAETGMAIYALLIQLFVLAQFSVVVAAFFVVASEAMSGVAILSVNIAFTLFMMQVNQPSIINPWRTEAIVWTPFARGMLAGELLVVAAALLVVMFVLSRRRDYV